MFLASILGSNQAEESSYGIIPMTTARMAFWKDLRGARCPGNSETQMYSQLQQHAIADGALP